MSVKISPRQISEELRRIASIIESSESPSLELVTNDISAVISKLQGTDKISVASKKIAKYILKVAENLEELDVSMWNTDEGEDVDAKYENAKSFNDGDKLETSVKMLKRSVDRFLKELMDPSGSSNSNSDVFTSAS